MRRENQELPLIDGVNFDRLRDWMDDQGLPQGALSEPKLLGGGTQNIVLHFERGGRSFVLRRPPLHLRANSNTTMLREARVLKALAGSDVPHPGFIRVCDNESVIGACFYLMEPVEGCNVVEGLMPFHAEAPDVRHQMGLSMVDAIAALSKVDYRLKGLSDFGQLDNWIERQVGRWGSQLESYSCFDTWAGPQAIPGVDDVAKWLHERQPKAFHPGIIHGDFHLANVMFRKDSAKLAAVVDWELCTLGDPMLDLGWLIATWPEDGTPRSTDVAITPWDGFPSADELAARYATLTGRDLGDLNWFVVLACFKLGIILEGTHARASAGKAPKETGDRLHAHTVSLFERALRRIG